LDLANHAGEKGRPLLLFEETPSLTVGGIGDRTNHGAVLMLGGRLSDEDVFSWSRAWNSGSDIGRPSNLRGSSNDRGELEANLGSEMDGMSERQRSGRFECCR
jgi:hypothetical protein